MTDDKRPDARTIGARILVDKLIELKGLSTEIDGLLAELEGRLGDAQQRVEIGRMALSNNELLAVKESGRQALHDLLSALAGLLGAGKEDTSGAHQVLTSRKAFK